MKIYKYLLSRRFSDINEISMPKGAQILSIQFQRGEITMWTLVNDTCEHNEIRTFESYGTGEDIKDPHELLYISTIQEGHFVWHIFEREPRKTN